MNVKKMRKEKTGFAAALRTGAVFAAIALGSCGIFSGCQATPEGEAVVNRSDSAVAASADAAQSAGPVEALSMLPVQYRQGEHWADTVHVDDHFTVQADVDLQVPNTDVYPVVKLEKGEITQEQADAMIRYFAGDAALYQLPIVSTKADYESQILAIKETLAMDQANGYEDAVRADEETLEELQRSYEEAPESADPKEADTTFTYALDFDGQPVTEEGEQFVDVYTKTDDGLATFYVRAKGTEPDGAQFSYWTGSYATQSLDEDNLKYLQASSQAEGGVKEETGQSEEVLRARVDSYASHPVDLARAKEQAQAVLDALGIKDTQFTDAEKGYFAKDHEKEGDGSKEDGSGYDTPCAVLTFAKISGGIPCVQQQVAPGNLDLSAEGMCSAPFFPETGSMAVDEDGNVLYMEWANPAKAVQVVSEDQEILPFDEIKSRITDHLFYVLGYAGEEPRVDLEYTVEEADLVMTYTNAKDDPERALLVPAWRVKVEGTGPYFENPVPIGEYGFIAEGEQEVLINAIDGSPILMPGTLQGTR